MKAVGAGRIGVGQVASAALVLVTAMWGSTFFLIKDVLKTVPAVDFLAVRFTVAAVVLVVLLQSRVRRLSRARVRHGVVLGVVYGAAQILQTEGLARTPASVGGFVTGTYVVLTPILGFLVLRQRTSWVTWLAVLASTAGLAVLSLHGAEVSGGVLLILASAVLYALHILGLGRWSTSEDALGLAAVQMVAIAVVCVVGAVPHGITLPSTGGGWLATLYMALAAGALALILQTWAQAHLSATRAAIVMTMEPVFAAAFAVAFGGESLTLRMLLGGALVLLAMYLVELRPSETRPVSSDGEQATQDPGRVPGPGGVDVEVGDQPSRAGP